MGDVAKGIKSFKKGMKDPDTNPDPDQSTNISSEKKSSEDTNPENK